MIFSLIISFLLLIADVGAETLVEIITLNNRSLEEVLPVLEPLIEGQGAITGIDNKLIVRATPAAIATIKEVLKKIDTVPRNLLITVKQENNRAEEDKALSGTGRIGTEKPNNRSPSVDVEIRGQSQLSKNEKLETQRVLILEGRPAFIQLKQSIPYVERTFPQNTIQNRVVFKDIPTGFHVTPQIRGVAVVLQITPQNSSVEKNAVTVQEIATTLSVRIGEWVEIGGLLQDKNATHNGVSSISDAKSHDTKNVFLKVEIQP